MKQIRCEVCGSIDLIKQDGLFVCQSCGIQYSLEEVKKLMVEGTVKIDKSDEVQNLLKRAFLLLEDDEYEKADDILDQILNQEPENPEAYLGKLMAEYYISKPSDFIHSLESFEDSTNYDKIKRFGSEELKQRINGYLASIKDNIRENERRIAKEKTDCELAKRKQWIEEAKQQCEYRIEGNHCVLYKAKNKELSSVNILSEYNGYPVTEIKSYAFSDCPHLSKIDLGENCNLTSIGAGAFSGTDITYFIIPNGVTEIKYSTFDTFDFERITIPKSVTKIDFAAFYSLGHISITYQGTKAEWKAIKKSGYGLSRFGGLKCDVHCIDGYI